MAIMTEKTLEKWAEAVADAFFNEGVTLTDGVTKVAMEENLNPEQIKRLVEAVNTATFLQKFNSMANPDANSQDRVVEFETADANAVISRMLDKAKELLTETPERGGPLGRGQGGPGHGLGPCGMGGDLTADLPVTRSDAAPLAPEKEAVSEEPGEPKIQGHIVIMRLRKAAEELKTAEYQARVCFTEATQDLTDRFRRLNGASFEEFEKDAFYHYGEQAAPHLQLLRQALRKPTVNYDLSDMRKHARFVDTRTPEMRHLQEMMNWTKRRKHAEAALKKIEGDLARIA
jgi:hypothetical protein